jgi:fatty-acid desaturase
MIKQSNKKTSDNLEVEKIYPVYTEYMPIYLAIAVIAFELNNFIDISNSFTIVILFIAVFIIFSISNIGYLNPIWYFLGYRIYKIENTKANYIFIALKKDDYKSKDNIDDIIKIDEFVFIKREV